MGGNLIKSTFYSLAQLVFARFLIIISSHSLILIFHSLYLSICLSVCCLHPSIHPSILLQTNKTKHVLVVDHAGRTPLHWAAKHGRGLEAEALLAAGADKEARDNDGDTPADVGRREGFIELVVLLQATYDASGRKRTGAER